MGVSVLIHSRSVHSVLLFRGFGWKASMCTMGEVFTPPCAEKPSIRI